MNRTETYLDWYQKVKLACFKNYVDPLTGELDEQLEVNWAHRISIGGSTVPAIMGVSKWSSPQDVYDVMTGAVDNSKPVEELDKKFLFLRGHLSEPLVAQAFTEVTRIPTTDGVTKKDENRLWSECQIDRLTLDGTPVELKTASANPMQADGKRAFGKGCEFNYKGELIIEDDIIPVDYYLQCQKQLYLTNKPFMWLAVWIVNELGVRVFKIKRNEEMIDKIIEAEDDFMFNHVIPEVPIPVAEEEESSLEVKDDSAFADVSTLEKLNKLKEIKETLANLKKEEDNLSKEIKTQMGKALNLISVSGELLATKTIKTSRKFRTADFKNDYKELYKKYCNDTTYEQLNLISKKD